MIWLCRIAKRSLAILQQPIAKLMLEILATSYRLNRNDRVSSFYWIRGSKKCFLTCFSYFSRYFWYFREIATYYFLSASESYMRPHVSGTERMGFSKQDARGNLVVA